MKIYTVEFDPMWPVPSGLIIAANNLIEAHLIAAKTIRHTDKFTVKEVDTSNPCVVFYESGDY